MLRTLRVPRILEDGLAPKPAPQSPGENRF